MICPIPRSGPAPPCCSVRLVAVLAGIPEARVTVGRYHQRVVAAAAPIPGAGLASYRALEQRAAERHLAGWWK
ncbi:hypothetical protein [Sphingomonas sp.]|uniref:hypothetical protein n=1 Tax=Sphingomonas sp. TaxID=28214 RepID=UPI002FD94CB7